MRQPRAPRRPRELTGRSVLVCLFGFFGVVGAVNALMIGAAISTFGGVETDSSYKSGLLFKQEIAAAERQDARHWQVSGRLARDGAGQTVLDVNARDAGGAPLYGLAAIARLAHPADARLDRVIALEPAAAGAFRGATQAEPGQWELTIDLYRGGERWFRSRSRITLR